MKLTRTDLALLKDADTILYGNDAVDAGLALMELIAEVEALRVAVAAKVPLCPHCHAPLQRVRFESYYDTWEGWDCSADCGVAPEPSKTYKGYRA